MIDNSHPMLWRPHYQTDRRCQQCIQYHRAPLAQPAHKYMGGTWCPQPKNTVGHLNQSHRVVTVQVSTLPEITTFTPYRLLCLIAVLTLGGLTDLNVYCLAYRFDNTFRKILPESGTSADVGSNTIPKRCTSSYTLTPTFLCAVLKPHIISH